MQCLTLFFAFGSNVKELFAFVPYICEARRCGWAFRHITSRGGVNVRIPTDYIRTSFTEYKLKVWVCSSGPPHIPPNSFKLVASIPRTGRT